MTQVSQVCITLMSRRLQQLFNHRQKIRQRANRPEREGVRSAGGTASRGEQESGLNDRQRNLTIPELAGQAQIMAAEAMGRVGQTEVEIQERLTVAMKITGHGSSLWGFSCWLRLPSEIPACGRNRLRSG